MWNSARSGADPDASIGPAIPIAMGISLQHATNTVLEDNEIGILGVEANRLITDNLIAGGGYTIYGGANQNFGKTYNIKITNNRFAKAFFPNGGSYGPVASFDATGVGNQWTGNIWDENGAPVA